MHKPAGTKIRHFRVLLYGNVFGIAFVHNAAYIKNEFVAVAKSPISGAAVFARDSGKQVDKNALTALLVKRFFYAEFADEFGKQALDNGILAEIENFAVI